MKAFFLIFLFSFSVFAQAPSPSPSQKQYLNLRDKLFRDLQMFERTFQNDSDFLDLEKEMRKMLQDQLRGSLSDEDIQELLDPGSKTQAQSSADLVWDETESSRILKVKIKMPKDQPLDIKIEKNLIKISGKIKRANPQSHYSLSQILSVPQDCDSTQAKIEVDKEGYPVISFPKLTSLKVKSRKDFKNKNENKNEDEKVPAPVSGKGQSI